MTVFDPDPGLRWLFWLAHPDDELAIAGWLHRLVQARAPAQVVWLHRTGTREAESRKAANLIGLPPDAFTFHNFPDGDMVDHLGTLVEVASKAISDFRPDRVVCQAFEQGHLDHDACHYAMRQAWEGPLLELPMYHSYSRRWQTVNRFSDSDPGEELPLRRDEAELKRRIAGCYPSQRMGRLLGLQDRALGLVGRTPGYLQHERLRWVKPCPYDQPCTLGVENHPKWRRWREALAGQRRQVPSTNVSQADGALRPDARTGSHRR